MRTAMRPRYYCDHCNKGNGSPSAMRRHERGCTLNPARVCGMCAKLADEGGPDPAPPRDELRKLLDTQGFKAMCEAANDCPACILSVLRQITSFGEEGPLTVTGPSKRSSIRASVWRMDRSSSRISTFMVAESVMVLSLLLCGERYRRTIRRAHGAVNCVGFGHQGGSHQQIH